MNKDIWLGRGRLWGWLFIGHIIFSSLLYVVGTSSLFTAYHNGAGLWNFAFDSANFHQTAVALADFLHKGDWEEWGGTSQPIHVRILSLLYWLTIPKPWVFAPVNALAWCATVMVVYRIVRTLANDDTHILVAVALLYGFWPSNLMLSTQLMKEPFFNFGIALFILGWLRLLNGEASGRAIALVVGGFLVAVTIRGEPAPFLLLSALGGVAITAVTVRRSCGAAVVAVMVMILIRAGVSLASAEPLPASWSESRWAQELTEIESGVSAATERPMDDELRSQIATWMRNANFTRGFTFREKKDILLALAAYHRERLSVMLERLLSVWEPVDCVVDPSVSWFFERYVYAASQYRDSFLSFYLQPGSSVIDADIVFRSMGDVLNYAPRAIQIAFFAPFPVMWFKTGSTGGSTVRLLGGGEMVVWYLLYMGFFLFLLRSRVHNPPKIWFLFFMAMTIIPLGLFVPNAGTLFRMRFVYLIPVLVGGALGWWQFLRPGNDKAGVV